MRWAVEAWGAKGEGGMVACWVAEVGAVRALMPPAEGL